MEVASSVADGPDMNGIASHDALNNHDALIRDAPEASLSPSSAAAAVAPAASAHAPATATGSPVVDPSDRKPKKSSLTCTTCRARKVRCNGARDICSNCERLGFPCSYDDADPAAMSGSLPRRRVRQACLSCHSRKARCSGHVPACERCRSQGIDCVYRPSKRARITLRGEGPSPQSPEGDADDHADSDPGLTDQGSSATPSAYIHDIPCPDESFDALIGRTFDKFFRHVHHIPMYSFLHRASLMERYNSGKVEKALLLALIGITSYLTDMGPGMREFGDKCIDDAEGLIFADYTRPSTIKVQALMLIIKHRILSKKSPSAFMLLSVASRYAAALRLNHESPNLCFLAQESRRRLMWAIYCVDLGISGGYRDFSLWSADRIHVRLPCNERNFEFDLPQPTEKLVRDPHMQQAEDIGSLALYIRIQHMRRRIMEFTKRVVLSRNIKPDELQAGIWTLHKALDDWASQLPTSFQFSESSLRLRAYSPRICAFAMIHVWWRQCHCDLYRLSLVGLREALPRAVLLTLDEGFVDHCQRQCIEHALAMASMFTSMQKLNAKPVSDLDLAVCAYQCASLLAYASRTNGAKFDLTTEAVAERAKVCLQTIKDCCVGKTANGIRDDLEKLIAHGIGPRPFPAANDMRAHAFGRHVGARNPAGNEDPNLTNNPRFTTSAFTPVPTLTESSFPPSLVADPWAPESQVSGDVGPTPAPMTVPPSEIRPTPKPSANIPEILPSPDATVQEINNAYDGGLDGIGIENAVDYGMGFDQNLWFPSNDWLGVEALNGGAQG